MTLNMKLISHSVVLLASLSEDLEDGHRVLYNLFDMAGIWKGAFVASLLDACECSQAQGYYFMHRFREKISRPVGIEAVIKAAMSSSNWYKQINELERQKSNLAPEQQPLC